MRQAAKIGSVLLGVVACGALPGCYHHVIRAEGPGEQDVDIYQPNVSEKPSALEQFESAVWNDQPQSNSRSRGNSRL